MNIIKIIVRIAVALNIGLSPFVAFAAADANPSLPSVIDAGLALWVKSGESGVDLALDAWQKGGIMEGDSKVRLLSNFFRKWDRALGNYRSCDLLELKRIGRTSQAVYVCLNFERGAVYGRFLMYRSDKNWVVQDMDFSTKPEALMPWLAFEGGKYGE